MSRLEFIIEEGNLKETLAEERRQYEELVDHANAEPSLKSAANVISEYMYQPDEYLIKVDYGDKEHPGDYEIKVMSKLYTDNPPLVKIYVPKKMYMHFEALVKSYTIKLKEDINSRGRF